MAAVPSGPWEKWIPGVLNKRQVLELRDAGYLTDVDDQAVDASSVDLSLSADGFQLTGGSIKPNGANFLHSLKKDGLVVPLLPTNGLFLLEQRKTYLFRLRERLPLQKSLADAGFHGQATAKSSIGRLDVLARLIVDGMYGYEGFDPEGLARGTGDLFLELTPLTFRVQVKEGIQLSQLRLFYGEPKLAEVGGPQLWRAVYRGADTPEGTLSLNLQPHKIGGLEAVSFSARRNVNDPVPLWTREPRPDPCAYWKVHTATEGGRFTIDPGVFYILRSHERLCLPAGVAIYCRASDETIGEMRIHYAGFVHPRFGSDRDDGTEGTPLIFEVRGHDFPVSLKDREQMARLVFCRMSEDAAPGPKDYTNQELQLSKFFRPWPGCLRRDTEGVVMEGRAE